MKEKSIKNTQVYKDYMGFKKKPMTWYQLFHRIGKQTIHKTQNTKVQVMIDGELKECALVFTNNGSDFYLEVVN